MLGSSSKTRRKFSVRDSRWKNVPLISGNDRRPMILSSLFSTEISSPSLFSPLRFVALRGFAFAFAADRQHSVLQRNLDVLLAHAGQFDADNYVVVILIKIERR